MNGLFSNHISTQDILFKHARGVSDRSGKEFHAFHEIIYYLDGEAEFVSEKLHMPLQPETLIVIPKETYHQMIVHGDPHQYCRCLLQFSGSLPASGVTAFYGDDEIRYLFGKLMAAARSEDPAAPELLRAVLTLLLLALGEKREIADRTHAQSQLIQQAVHFIDRNMSRTISLPEIAETCSVSVSTLSHAFKSEMNVSIHQFIIKKRLMRACHRISAGQSATAAALECGFCDYSAFYRQYKKHFGTSPAQKLPNGTVI